jgi:hypothetical protein
VSEFLSQAVLTYQKKYSCNLYNKLYLKHWKKTERMPNRYLSPTSSKHATILTLLHRADNNMKPEGLASGAGQHAVGQQMICWPGGC